MTVHLCAVGSVRCLRITNGKKRRIKSPMTLEIDVAIQSFSLGMQFGPMRLKSQNSWTGLHISKCIGRMMHVAIKLTAIMM